MIGTPNDKDFPFLKTLPDWKQENFEQYEVFDLTKFVPNLSPSGMDLLKSMLQFDPEKRISAVDALNHPFFDDLDADLKKSFN